MEVTHVYTLTHTTSCRHTCSKDTDECQTLKNDNVAQGMSLLRESFIHRISHVYLPAKFDDTTARGCQNLESKSPKQTSKVTEGHLACIYDFLSAFHNKFGHSMCHS